MDENQLGTNGGTFSEVMRPKLQQKKLWDQIETFTKVMGSKVNFSLISLNVSKQCSQ